MKFLAFLNVPPLHIGKRLGGMVVLQQQAHLFVQLEGSQVDIA